MLRANDLRVPRTVSAGDPIRIRLIGQGFAVSAEGFAMAAAGEGEPLRVRTGSGKMLVGIVRERILEVRL
jgi:flagella basal body P-ring formation protein FlgA